MSTTHPSEAFDINSLKFSIIEEYIGKPNAPHFSSIWFVDVTTDGASPVLMFVRDYNTNKIVCEPDEDPDELAAEFGAIFGFDGDSDNGALIFAAIEAKAIETIINYLNENQDELSALSEKAKAGASNPDTVDDVLNGDTAFGGRSSSFYRTIDGDGDTRYIAEYYSGPTAANTCYRIFVEIDTDDWDIAWAIYDEEWDAYNDLPHAEALVNFAASLVGVQKPFSKAFDVDSLKFNVRKIVDNADFPKFWTIPWNTWPAWHVDVISDSASIGLTFVCNKRTNEIVCEPYIEPDELDVEIGDIFGFDGESDDGTLIFAAIKAKVIEAIIEVERPFSGASISDEPEA